MKHIWTIAVAIRLLAVPVFAVAQSGREVDADSNAQLAGDDKKLNAAYVALPKEIRAHNPKDRTELVIEPCASSLSRDFRGGRCGASGDSLRSAARGAA